MVESRPDWLCGRDANLYRYVGNSPTNALDPNGMNYNLVDDGKGNITITVRIRFLGMCAPKRGRVNKGRDREALKVTAGKYHVTVKVLDPANGKKCNTIHLVDGPG